MYRQKTRWSSLSVVITLLTLVLLAGAGLYCRGNIISFIIWGIMALMCLSALFFFPIETRVGSDSLEIVFPLRIKSIPLERIRVAEPYQATMNFVRIFGSGAFFGWWGWFSNRELGRFMVYASELMNLVLIRLDDGRKYVISCGSPEEMCSAVNSGRRK